MIFPESFVTQGDYLFVCSQLGTWLSILLNWRPRWAEAAHWHYAFLTMHTVSSVLYSKTDSFTVGNSSASTSPYQLKDMYWIQIEYNQEMLKTGSTGGKLDAYHLEMACLSLPNYFSLETCINNKVWNSSRLVRNASWAQLIRIQILSSETGRGRRKNTIRFSSFSHKILWLQETGKLKLLYPI